MPPLRRLYFPDFSRSGRSFTLYGRPFPDSLYGRHLGQSLYGRPSPFERPSSWNDELRAARIACRIKREISNSMRRNCVCRIKREISNSRRTSSVDTDDDDDDADDDDDESGQTSVNECESELSFDGYCTSRGLSLKNVEESERLSLEMLWKEVNDAKTKLQAKQSELDAKICHLNGGT